MEHTVYEPSFCDVRRNDRFPPNQDLWCDHLHTRPLLSFPLWDDHHHPWQSYYPAYSKPSPVTTQCTKMISISTHCKMINHSFGNREKPCGFFRREPPVKPSQKPTSSPSPPMPCQCLRVRAPLLEPPLHRRVPWAHCVGSLLVLT